MRIKILFIGISLLYFNSFSQNNIENLINQIASQKVSQTFRHYYLFEKSIKIDTSYFCKSCKDNRINNRLKKELLKIDPNMPIDLFDRYTDTTLNWKNYNLENVKYVSESYPKYHKKVYTLNKKLNRLDSLIENKKPQTLFIRKKWFWNKSRVWKEVKKAWKKDDEINIEDKTFYSLSYPIFSSDKNYVKITIQEQHIENGIGSTLIYRLKNGNWEKVFEYNETETKHIVTDTNPNGMYTIFEKFE